MKEKIDLAVLDKIIKGTIDHLEKGKEQISDIAEFARQEREDLHSSLLKIKSETLQTIEQVDGLEVEERSARLNLMRVSRDFKNHSEADIKSAYDQAKEVQMKLGLLRERESQLRIRRDQMELSLRRLNTTLEKAENLVSKVGVALNFLVGNLLGLGIKIEEIQQKQQLGLRIIKAQEEERKRVAREIHDGPAQAMANVVLRVEICEKLLEINTETLKEELVGLKELVKDSLREVRKIIFDLRPMVLDDLGLIPALKRYIAEFQEMTELTIDFRALGSNQKRLGSALEIAIFRIIQEALTNVDKHAQADRVTVYVEQTKEQLNLRIRDDGRGFDSERVIAGNSGDSYGLIGIQERVELLDGSFKLSSAARRGTDITVQIPLKRAE